MDNVPIIFIHKSNSSYLKYALRQAKHFNPNSTIHLLGDNSNKKYDFVKHHQIQDYNRESNAFKKIYKHLSSLNFDNVLFWYQRWFILREFVTANNFNDFLYIDSDVLLYCDATEEFRKYKKYKLTVYDEGGPQYSYFSDPSALTEYCELINKFYTDPIYLDQFIQHFEKFKAENLPGGIDDMSTRNEFWKKNKNTVIDLVEIRNNSTFDGSFGYSEGFEMFGGFKKIYWKNKFPYVRHLQQNKLIRLNAIHFQGGAKRLMGKYYMGKGLYMKKMIDSIKANFLILRYLLRIKSRVKSLIKST